MDKISRLKEELASLSDNIDNTIDELNKLKKWDRNGLLLALDIMATIDDSRVEIRQIVETSYAKSNKL